MPAANSRVGRAVESIPTLRPAMMLVACPVWDCLMMKRTGFRSIAVKYSVSMLISMPTLRPITMA